MRLICPAKSPPPRGFCMGRYTRAMDRLWTPWRYSYITRADPQSRSGVPAALNAWPPTEAEDKHCIFCNMIAAVDYAIAHGMPRETAEEAAQIVHRGPHCFVCLNVYPYTTGHVMILPYQHLSSLAALPLDAANEMMEQRLAGMLREECRRDGRRMLRDFSCRPACPCRARVDFPPQPVCFLHQPCFPRQPVCLSHDRHRRTARDLRLYRGPRRA